MNVTRWPTVSVILLGAIAVAIPAIAINRRPAPAHKLATEPGIMVRNSVIKVHTSRGVVTLPGTAESWEAVESALFLAEGIKDIELANAQLFPTPFDE